MSRSIGIDEARGDQVTLQNLQFERKKSRNGEDGISQAMDFSQTYIAPFAGLFKYLFVLILLFILYKKVIVPFADKMLEVSQEEDELAKPILTLTDDEGEDLVEKVQAMRKKVEDQLNVGSGFNEDELKYEVILEKVRAMAEDAPADIASLLQALLVEEQETSNVKDRG